MTVFKSYLKILKKYIPMIIIYTAMLVFFAIIATQSNNAVTNLEAVVPDVAIINNDKETKLLETFTNYISKNTQIVEIENDENSIQDALFFREITYVLIIPENYTDNLLNGKKPTIEIKKTQDGYSTYMELMIQRFLKIVDIYSKTGMNEEEICTYIVEDLKNESDITIRGNLAISEYSKAKQYYNFSNYIFLTLCTLIISEIMINFKKESVIKRNKVSSTPYRKITFQIFLGNLIFIILIWGLYVGISFILYKEVMTSKVGLLLMLNSFIFIITATAIGMLIATIIKSTNAINGIVNIISLGLSFISGSFVSQKYLGNIILGIAKFFPSYWFVTNNNKIVEINNFNFETLKPIFTNMSIVVVYAIIIFIVIKILNDKINTNGKIK